jgi:hypothetical protein
MAMKRRRPPSAPGKPTLPALQTAAAARAQEVAWAQVKEALSSPTHGEKIVRQLSAKLAFETERADRGDAALRQRLSEVEEEKSKLQNRLNELEDELAKLRQMKLPGKHQKRLILELDDMAELTQALAVAAPREGKWAERQLGKRESDITARAADALPVYKVALAARRAIFEKTVADHKAQVEKMEAAHEREIEKVKLAEAVKRGRMQDQLNAINEKLREVQEAAAAREAEMKKIVAKSEARDNANDVQSLKMAAANYFWSIKAVAEDREERLEEAHSKVQLLEEQLLSPGRGLSVS